MSLYLKHRPTTFAGVVGQQEAIKILQGKLPDLPHTVLLSGVSGVGKTTIARILAKELGCEGYNLTEINCADVRGIDFVRDINESMHLAPMGGKCRVWLLDEVVQLPKTTQQAFLKILEDTPKHVWFLLCTSETSGLLPTFLGRCFHLALSPLTGKELYTIMYKCLEAETYLKGLNPVETIKGFPGKVLDAIVPLTNGSGRMALQLLEAALTQTNEADMLKAIGVAGQEQEEKGEFLAHALLRRAKWAEIKPIIEGVEDKDLELLRRQVLKYAEKSLIGSGNKQAYLMICSFRDGWGWCGKSGLVAACWECVRDVR